jgi:hypothetical protein
VTAMALALKLQTLATDAMTKRAAEGAIDK